MKLSFTIACVQPPIDGKEFLQRLRNCNAQQKVYSLKDWKCPRCLCSGGSADDAISLADSGDEARPTPGTNPIDRMVDNLEVIDLTEDAPPPSSGQSLLENTFVAAKKLPNDISDGMRSSFCT